MELVRRTLQQWPVLVVAAIALAILIVAARPERAEAHAGEHTIMFFGLNVSTGTLGSGCNAASSGVQACTVPVGAAFPVGFIMQKGSDVQWNHVRFSISYTGVTAKDNPQFADPEGCLDPTNLSIDAQVGSLTFDCTLSSPSGFIASGFLDFNCTETPSLDNEIRLFVGTGDADSYVVDEFGERHSPDTEVLSVFINCIEPERADMHLEIEGGDALCDLPDAATICNVPLGGSFTLAVATDDPPLTGYDGFFSEVLYAGLQYNPAPDDASTPVIDEGAEVEVVWPNNRPWAGRLPSGLTLTGNEGFIRHSETGPDLSSYAGNLVEMSMTCSQTGVFPITLTSRSYPEAPNGSFFYYFAGASVLLNSEDTVTIQCGVDKPVGGVPLDNSLRVVSAGGTTRSGYNLLFATTVSVSAITVVFTVAWYTKRRWPR